MAKSKYTKIAVFGDSIAWGKGDTELGGWVNRLKIELNRRNSYCEVLDVCVPGDTTRNLLARFESETAARSPDIVIFAIGINDSQYIKTPDRFKVPPDEFAGNIKTLIGLARKSTNTIGIVGLSRVDESKTCPIYSTSCYYTNENVKKYDQILAEAASAQGILFIPLFDIIGPADLPDGLHIAAAGHQKISDQVKMALLAQFPNLLYTSD